MLWISSAENLFKTQRLFCTVCYSVIIPITTLKFYIITEKQILQNYICVLANWETFLLSPVWSSQSQSLPPAQRTGSASGCHWSALCTRTPAAAGASSVSHGSVACGPGWWRGWSAVEEQGLPSGDLCWRASWPPAERTGSHSSPGPGSSVLTVRHGPGHVCKRKRRVRLTSDQLAPHRMKQREKTWSEPNLNKSKITQTSTITDKRWKQDRSWIRRVCLLSNLKFKQLIFNEKAEQYVAFKGGDVVVSFRKFVTGYCTSQSINVFKKSTHMTNRPDGKEEK